MIQNGALTYGARNEGILTWRFSNDVLNEVIIAALLTIISYQTIETLINLSFGFKPRGQATLRDLQIMLLIRKFSPKAILRAIFPSFQGHIRGAILPGRSKGKNVVSPDFIDDMSETYTGTGRSGSRNYAYLKLFCLLLAIPLVNIGSVVLSLERDVDFTFAEGKFGGLALGLDFNRSFTKISPLSRIPQGFCGGTTLETNAAEFPIALFHTCVRDMSSTHDANRNNKFVVAVDTNPTEIVFVSVQIGSQKVLYEKRLMILSEKANTSLPERNRKLYYVKQNLQISEALLLVDHGVKLARSFCDIDINNSTGVENEVDEDIQKGKLTVSAFGACPRESERTRSEDFESVLSVAQDLLSRLSFVDSDELQVRPAENEERKEFVNGDHLLLLSRRRALVSVPVMGILALAVVLLRIIVQLATSNDLEKGIGLIVRDGLGLPCCDSMLCSPDIVAQYDSRDLFLYNVDRSYADPEEAETLKG